ncbi:PREDICTED: UDP-glycosyltransferase 71A15-like [Nelumbo nucifera]|uniref:Uncharacterized protein n=2 Tax=Nelumbo nucifera TaxID=4432 RepID=A0A822ZX58_NELNU|nr:PREDICTED: UDP-glycosyltransferase 71A15-like [Nelumbo nucifera]DAD48121.1 TPA_asm: hypothetical protein HUJ06_018058 [Nelumbo nucifera]
MKWLDNQPSSSVVFLCFGSLGAFNEAQMKEIAVGLERSGHGFLWSVRRPAETEAGTVSDYTNLEVEEVLPDGFLDRTAGRGLVCGWAPQVEILGHRATGDFVSHCGWNSTLESLWFGVAMLAWPVYAEQKVNASVLVKEMGLAVDVGCLKRTETDGGDVVTAEDVERGIVSVMDSNNVVRERVGEMKEKSRKAETDGGCSFASLQQLMDDVMESI